MHGSLHLHIQTSFLWEDYRGLEVPLGNFPLVFLDCLGPYHGLHATKVYRKLVLELLKMYIQLGF